MMALNVELKMNNDFKRLIEDAALCQNENTALNAKLKIWL